MKRIWILLLISLFVVACNQVPEKEETAPQEPTNEQGTNGQLENEEEENVDKEDKTENVEKEEEQEDQEKEEQAEPNNETESTEVILQQLSEGVFKAQREEDYAYLQEHIAESVNMDKENNGFYFDDITYPHEMAFVQEEEENIEFRYSHEEDDGTVTLGYAIVDYEKEMSFTIVFQFVEEDGAWKMKDMDKNA